MLWDSAAIKIEHVRLDDDGRYLETLNTSLNDCFSLSANIDQTGRAMIQDAVMSIMDEGHVAIVPTDVSMDPRITTSYNIEKLRVGKIIKWMPEAVTGKVYNERTGKTEELTVLKKTIAIIENPLYAVMNEPTY